MQNSVLLANMLTCFNSRNDKYWSNKDIICNCCAEIQGTRSCNEVS